MSVLRGILLALATALVVVFGLGYFSFGAGIQEAQPPNPLPEADAIVALTGGGRARLTTAMTLLEEGRGRRLLISGVNPATPAADVHAILGGAPATIACCVDLGRSAEDTLGNATETAAWAKRNGFNRLILVTEDYHMPRSLKELAIALPGAKLLAYPVRTRMMERGNWRTDLSVAPILLGEYVKYLMIRAREVMLGTDHPPDAPPPADLPLSSPAPTAAAPRG
jgi:uncharacterized SAM-binding protein YcdF (DUF218 family)